MSDEPTYDELYAEVEKLEEVIRTLRDKNEELSNDFEGAQDEVETLESELTNAEQKADRLHDAIVSAINDLSMVDEVPLGDVEDSISEIVKNLRSALRPIQ